MHNFQKSHAKQSGNFGTTRNHSSRDRGRSEECSMYNPTRGNRDMNNSQQPSGELNNDLHSFLGGRGGGTFSRNPRSTVHGNHDIRARSENRARTVLRPDVHYTSSEPHRSSGSYSRQDQTNSTEKDRGHGDARAKTRERDDSRGKRGSYTQSQARASRDQSSGSRGLSQRHKSPGRYASQNMIAASGNKTRGMDHLSVFQQKKNTFGNRTQSLQNLLDVSTDYNGSERSNSHGFRGTTASNKGKGSHIVKKLNNLMITNLSMLEPSEIVMKLAAPGNGLKELLNESSIDFQLLESLLKVLNKAIGCKTNRQNLIHLLSHVQGSVFLKQVLPLHILASERTATHQNIEFIDHILVLLTEVVSIFPFSSFTEVTIGETLLQKAIHEMQTSGKIVPEEIQKKLMTLHTFLQHLQEKKQEGTLRSDNYVYKIGNQANIEDDDFQSISIFPTRKDIYLDQNPCMRPNIINGSYPDAKSYLDTHFRLLREDFIRPLRDGISQLLTLQSKELAKAKLDDIRIYFNTQILSPVCTRAGIVHQVQFSMRNLKQVTWEISRRLLYGALVCLSKDNFENMLFATVADRSVTDLQKGIITLMFTEESRQKLAEHTIDDTFLMVETMAYFEAYRHVLEGLKEMVDSEIPFQNYIVHCDTTMSAPVYLGQDRSGYSLEKLIKKSPTREKICSRGIKTSSETMLTLLRNRYSNKQVAQFDVLDFMTWPTKEELELDRSQFEAFQMALTSELSIVQGPPGTGKTYVGLKIVHSLLANSQIWKQGHSPILIVCYTNHALDQFLEGILKYSTCSMVRVGSRSSSEILQEFSLTKIRSNRSHVNLPGYMRAMNAELYGEKKNVEEMLNEKASGLQNAVRGILHENTLEKYILPRHFTCLISQKEYMENPGSSSRISSFIVEWLGVSVVYQSAQERRNCYHTQRELQLWEVESVMDENDSLDEFTAQEEEADEDFIKVSEEAEQAEAERKFEEEDDIKKQIRIARERAARRGRGILAFLPDEQDDDDQDNDTDEGGWQITKDMKKKLKKQIKHELQMTCHMTEEVEQIHDLWQLPMLKRWDLYRSWRSKYLTDIRLQIFDLENLYQVVVKRLIELRNQEDVLILQGADIIGMTTTGAAKYRKILQDIRPKIVVVEEAAEVLEAHIITTLSSGCQHLILIGDHQQLRPSAAVYELARNFNLEVSMFERLIRMNIPYVRLDYQHRMRPEIAQLLTPHIYDKLENDSSVYEYDSIKGVGGNLFFVDHNHLEEQIHEGKSRQNIHEAAFVRCLCLYFIHQGYDPSQITVLTTYTGQLHCLQKMMPKSKFEGVRLCVVDKYQGEENEIIILSLVRSNLEGQVGFLKIPNRVCVALSRAKKGLFCIGNMQMLSNVPLWSKINDVLKANGQIGRELKLQCENHPNTLSYVSTSEDFKNVPEGGCTIPCEYRLNCGHVCTLLCHPYDPEHKKFICNKPCPKVICENGHKCKKKCSEPCGKCEVLVPKKIPTCGHIQDVQCSRSPDKFICKEPCTKTLECGHQCFRSCGEICTRKCPEKVTVELECGHTIKTLCHLKSEAEMNGCKLICNVSCQEGLSCGHPCPGNCSICLKDGPHMDCAKQCDIVLLCSHRCEEKCSKDCICCLRVCERKCFHGKCSHKCNDPCAPCTKLCGWRCMHEKCTKLCWESCNRKPCDKPCKKTLKCGHPCIGLCGEPCPTKCRQCNADEVTELFFGKEADPEARFVQLMNCPHIFEVTEFSKWMNQKEEDQVIKLKSCPKCSKAIRQSLRYGDLIKQTLSDIETVKERIVCNWLNQLEVFLNENEAVLRHFPAASQAMQQDRKITLRTLMLVSEKLQFWLKLGAIKNKVEEVPQLQHYAVEYITILSDKIVEAKRKIDILEEHYKLFVLSLEVEIAYLEKHLSDQFVQDARDLIKQMNFGKKTITLEEVHAKLRKFPESMKLITLINDKKSIVDTAMLRQDHWHKCSAGHIYIAREDKENMLPCPQCNHDAEDQD